MIRALETTFFTSPLGGEVDHAKRGRVRGLGDDSDRTPSPGSQLPLLATLSPEGRGKGN